jgi:hypothetical protein
MRRSVLFAFLLAVPLSAATASAQQFFAEAEGGGEVNIVDASGTDVPVVDGDPFGTRPDTCPSDSYYFNELDSDKAQLVLTDCATGLGTYTVEILN